MAETLLDTKTPARTPETTTTAPSSTPIPPELECRIFELAALSRPVWIPTLMLVARRVQHWVEPILYRVVFVGSDARIAEGFPVFTKDRLLTAIATKTPSFISHAIQNINLDHPVEPTQLAAILDVCSGLRNLVVNDSPGPALPALARLEHLCRLETVAEVLLRLDATKPVFPSLTHLQLSASHHGEKPDLNVAETYAALRLLPRLTHLALGMYPNQFVVDELRADARLHCIAFITWYPTAGDAALFADDMRFVEVVFDTDYALDWVRGADTGDDYWKVADAFIAAKRAGKIDSTQYEVVLSAYEYISPPVLD
ncbi:hypothetical protein C8R46DRAFT_1352043 [Mycena filopes]|nr:hypothetical protein C8R46DRAFT_1352043 [Mycena filopes]